MSDITRFRRHRSPTDLMIYGAMICTFVCGFMVGTAWHDYSADTCASSPDIIGCIIEASKRGGHD